MSAFRYYILTNNGQNTPNLLYIFLLTIVFIIAIPISMKLGQYIFGNNGGTIGLCILLVLPLIYLQYKQNTDKNKDIK
jgi:predicted ABC-type exoprotein transport system permease subunit